MVSCFTWWGEWQHHKFFPGASETREVSDPFWKLALHPNDVILRKLGIVLDNYHVW